MRPKGFKPAIVQAVEPADRECKETIYTVIDPGERYGKPFLLKGVYYTYEQTQPLHREGLIIYQSATIDQAEGLRVKGVLMG